MKRVFRACPGDAVVVALLSLGIAGLTGVQLYLTKAVVDALTAFLAGNARPPAARALLLMLSFQAGACLLGSALNRISSLRTTRLSTSFGRKTQQQVADVVTAVDPIHFEDAAWHDRLARTCGQTLYAPLALTQTATTTLILVLRTITACVVLAALSPALLGALVVLLAPSVLVANRRARLRFGLERSRTQRQRHLGYAWGTLLGRYAVPELRVSRLGEFLKQRWMTLRGQSDAEDVAFARSAGRESLALEVVFQIASVGATLFLAYVAVAAGATLGTIMMGVSAFRTSAEAVRLFGASVGQVAEHGLSLSELRELLLSPQRQTCGARLVSPSGAWSCLEFKNVSFRYPTSRADVLRQVSLRLTRGGPVAIAGPSGSGKTTLLKLLVRLFDPRDGVITLDGQPIADFELTSYRRLFAVRWEQASRLPGTEWENITLGAAPDPERIARFQSAVQGTHLRGVLSDPVHGQGALVAGFDRGRELSEGEWSRVILARTIFAGAPILVFDEPTHGLDQHTEQLIVDHLRDLGASHTLIIVSHRPAVVALADQVYFLQHGQITGSGTYEELLQSDEAFARWHGLAAVTT